MVHFSAQHNLILKIYIVLHQHLSGVHPLGYVVALKSVDRAGAFRWIVLLHQELGVALGQ